MSAQIEVSLLFVLRDADRNEDGAVDSSDAPGEQLGVQCLAHGHFDLQLLGRAGIEPTTLGLQDDPLPH
ncbi:hypothetical protein EYF80_042523 [Liparis tanakae]|uniref:Uncharacterized protein n=1 Tax=Liparis tanakae TaxID=230148 RepID=A0A4Z2G179_9TELE|nr:hypothetical protein EYF80_042523 [Liparis tanakae]